MTRYARSYPTVESGGSLGDSAVECQACDRIEIKVDVYFEAPPERSLISQGGESKILNNIKDPL